MSYKISNKYKIVATQYIDDLLYVHVIGPAGMIIVKWRTVNYLLDQDLIDYLIAHEDDILSGKYNLKLSWLDKVKRVIALF